jgi:hypothetical protein
MRIIPSKVIDLRREAALWAASSLVPVRTDAMSDEKIYVDASRPATLNNGGILDDYRTLQDALAAWHQLPPEQKKRATIRVMGGPLYTVAEIERLHLSRKPRS